MHGREGCSWLCNENSANSSHKFELEVVPTPRRVHSTDCGFPNNRIDITESHSHTEISSLHTFEGVPRIYLV